MILNEWTSDTSGRLKYRLVTGNEEINIIMFYWFNKVGAKGLRVSGPIIQTEALKVAASLGKTGFKASLVF